MILFFWLLVGHALADYPLQGSFLSTAKRRGGIVTVPWQIALSAHALIHAGFVAALTGSPYLGLAEFVLHSLIDFAKCEGYFRRRRRPALHDQTEMLEERRAFWIDQSLHVACKALWAVL